MKIFLYIIALSLVTSLSAQNDVKETRKQEKDPEEVREEKEKLMKEQMAKIEAQAEKGNRAAILEVGNNYFYGRGGVEQDLKKAIFWYQKGADLNSRQCQFNLAGCYVRGTGVKQDVEKALELYMIAADFGLKEANINAALILDSLRRYEKARLYFTKAAALDDARATKKLAHYYEHGLGGDQKHAVAAQLYLKLAKNGDALSQLKIADYLNQGIGV